MPRGLNGWKTTLAQHKQCDMYLAHVVVLKAQLLTFCSYRVLIAVASANQDIQEIKSGDARLRGAAEIEPSIHAVSMPVVLRRREEKWHVLWVHKFLHLNSENQPFLGCNWGSLCGCFIQLSVLTRLWHTGYKNNWAESVLQLFYSCSMSVRHPYSCTISTVSV